MRNPTGSHMFPHGKKLLTYSSYFPLKSGDARGTPNFPRFRGIPRKSAEIKVSRKSRVPARRWRPTLFSTSYGPRWRIPTDGCGPPTCGSCDFFRGSNSIFRGKTRKSGFSAEKWDLPKSRSWPKKFDFPSTSPMIAYDHQISLPNSLAFYFKPRRLWFLVSRLFRP